LGEGIKKVMYRYFVDCERIEYLNIPKSVTEMFLIGLRISNENIHIAEPTGWVDSWGRSIDLTNVTNEDDTICKHLTKKPAVTE
jgi:hypothetical protein